MAAPVAYIVNYTRMQPLTSYFHHCQRSKRWIYMKTVNRRSICHSLIRHVATVVSGTELARQIHKEVQSDIAKLLAQGNRRPHLSVILVGDDHASHTYVRNKTRTASLLGMSSSTIFRPSSISQEELLELIDKCNRNRGVSGLLVQLPLPEHISERAVCNAVAPEKDVDGFHIVNIGKLCLDQRCMVPATAAAVWEIIRRTGIDTVGKNVLVVGRSKNVGMPIAMLLHSDRNHERPGGDATVIIAHRCTPLLRLKELASLADVVIAAAGVPHLITADMVKEGAAVIDVGINRIQDSDTGKIRLVGDVDFEVKEKAGFITPVPGGVGPMTIAMVMKNTVTAAKNAPTY
ncbi:bifunctional methylenetetrahydrofolate dehydrogenase/cyclohydrolase 2, mitochondrial-like isoform X2 [Myxocyprinus asiaticus]|uniref:bifunctional methylenetetrahydrofolate dehydrogenase/cyclohydrolase 2, mitochondrial-like isoform X2 n=1 Tax=Myxocyprinus asiaticus TaxID=70543 RepID=UPI0022232DAB|nr:bifunctional methylenetetrahydrofolate dehydrogenase/cyclohydrolase 2, mitochondrial-like isoform X2 [Myxocyprinus asiaticus]